MREAPSLVPVAERVTDWISVLAAGSLLNHKRTELLRKLFNFLYQR